MYLYITRHGETEWNTQRRTQGIQDIGLTDKGRQQARVLRDRLIDVSIDRIYCSDLHRAVETASIVAAGFNMGVVSTPLLREVSFGCWEGYTIEEIEQKFPGQLNMWNQDFSFYPDQGESISSVQLRVRSFIRQLKKYDINELDNALIVSHALTNKILILELMEMPLIYLKNIRQDNTALSILEISHDKNMIITLNDSCHLNK
jgi:broad specificity phosphatase PhoE